MNWDTREKKMKSNLNCNLENSYVSAKVEFVRTLYFSANDERQDCISERCACIGCDRNIHLFMLSLVMCNGASNRRRYSQQNCYQYAIQPRTQPPLNAIGLSVAHGMLRNAESTVKCATAQNYTLDRPPLRFWRQFWMMCEMTHPCRVQTVFYGN